ncbi:VanW family protein [Bacillota bacterium Meth-B3]
MSSTWVARRRKRRTRGGLPGLFKMAAVIAAVTFAIVLLIRFATRGTADDRFCEGVYVDGVSLGGMSYDEGAQRVLGRVQERLSGTFTLTHGERQWTFTPSQFGAHLSADAEAQLKQAWNWGKTGTAREKREQVELLKANPQYYDSEIVYDEAMFTQFLEGIAAEISVPAVEATVIPGLSEQLTVEPSRDGLGLSVEDLRSTLDAAIREGSGAEIALQTHVLKPARTTEDTLQNTQLIVYYVTSTKASSSNRTKNIRRALQAFDGFEVRPGQTVSINEVVGPRTVERGFFEAPEYNGTEIISGIGGGTCQASSTLYGALLLANMDIVERQSHNMTVAYVKASMDAVVSLQRGREKDLRFTNPLPYSIFIYTHVDQEKARVRIYGPQNAYEIQLDHRIVDQKPPKKSRYVPDTKGKIVYYKDEEPVLKTEGKDMVKSVGMRIYYDRATGQEVDRQVFDQDTYYEKQPEYWVGVHERGFEG